MMCSAVWIFLSQLILISLTVHFTEASYLPLEAALKNVSRIKRQSSCENDFFRCNSGECLPEALQCDGTANCADGSDETKEICSGIPCRSIFFQCKYGACINSKLECDGKRDCADNSDEETPRCTNKGKCKAEEFECKSAECISSEVLCDGRADCRDSSDETSEQCSNVPCPTYAFRCSYGGCVSSKAKCNGVRDCADGSDEVGCPVTLSPITTSTTTPTTPLVPPTSGCVLPPHPKYGKFQYYNPDLNYVPNVVVPDFSVIMVSCHKGFDAQMTSVTICQNKQWVPAIPERLCIPRCKSLKRSHTYTVKCTLNRKEVSCDNAQEGTIAISTCNNYYMPSKIDYFPTTDIICAGGSWSEDPDECIPECGRKHVSVGTLSIGGTEAQKGEYPWVVAVYNASNEHICGGSIIHEKYILSAAHCFTNDVGELFKSSDYKIAAGTFFRKFNYSLDINKQIVNVQDIYTPFYRGSVQQFSEDIALVKLQTRLKLSKQVQPVCLDNIKYNADDLVDNTTAVVAGWGFTTEGGAPSDTLKKLIVPYRTREVCVKHLPSEFGERYYTHDKMCAGYIDKGISVCSGDSGGGLYFRSIDTLYYVRGIVSLSPNTVGGDCSSNHFALYTKVSKHINWIKNTIKETFF